MIYMANIFRYTIDDCEKVLSVVKDYVEIKLSRVSDNRKYTNYVMFLNLYEQRNAGTLFTLLQLLEEYNTREHLVDGTQKSTVLSCFYTKYINNKCSGKRVENKKRENDYCKELIEYIVSYSSIYKMMYGYAYAKDLRNRLDRLKDKELDNTFVGFEEVGLNLTTIKKLKDLGYFSLSDLLNAFYSSKIKLSDKFFGGVFSTISKYDILDEIYNKDNALKGKMVLDAPYTYLYIVFGENSDIVRNLYTGPNSKEIYLKLINESLEKLTPREQAVIKDRYGIETGKTMSLEEVGLKYCVTRERIRQIEERALRKLRHPTFLSSFKIDNVLKLVNK